MAKQLQKLELTWIGKGKDPQLEPRILIEDPSKSFGDGKTQNMLIHGDNLLALRALEQNFANKIKCIYIDPPYNTGNAFEHYDDGIEHSIWLNLMNHRLKLLQKLLSSDGSIFVQIDDEESAYLKVLMDEVFGRQNFINTISINMKNIAGASGGGEDKKLKKNIEYIHIYAKDYAILPSFKGVYDFIPIAELVEKYREEGKSWKYTSILFFEGNKKYIGSTLDGDGNEIKIYLRTNPIFKSINQIMKEEGISEKDAYYKYSDKIFEAKDAQSSIRQRIIISRETFSINEDLISIEYVPKTGRNKGKIYEQYYKGEQCRLLAWLSDIGETIDGVLYKKNRLGTYWDATSTINNLNKEGGVQFPNGKKPESLISRIIEMCTDRNDYVLDSFLGSGTTAATAHKMNRKYIGIEMGDQATTHCLPRLKQVVNGEDKGGITEAVNWKGGGGFKFYNLAPSLIKYDKYGNEIINPAYNANMLAAAMAVQEGFKFQPLQDVYWKQGYSTEKDFIYTTTQFITVEMLDRLHEEMLPTDNLLICCKSFDKKCIAKHSNITIKKIPQMLKDRCQFDRDDYSFNIVNLPHDEKINLDADGEVEEPIIKKTKGKAKKDNTEKNQSSLF
jgi:adenine-specific DNA-methyltransferase